MTNPWAYEEKSAAFQCPHVPKVSATSDGSLIVEGNEGCSSNDETYQGPLPTNVGELVGSFSERILGIDANEIKKPKSLEHPPPEASDTPETPRKRKPGRPKEGETVVKPKLRRVLDGECNDEAIETWNNGMGAHRLTADFPPWLQLIHNPPTASQGEPRRFVDLANPSVVHAVRNDSQVAELEDHGFIPIQLRDYGFFETITLAQRERDEDERKRLLAFHKEQIALLSADEPPHGNVGGDTRTATEEEYEDLTELPGTVNDPDKIIGYFEDHVPGYNGKHFPIGHFLANAGWDKTLTKFNTNNGTAANWVHYYIALKKPVNGIRFDEEGTCYVRSEATSAQYTEEKFTEMRGGKFTMLKTLVKTWKESEIAKITDDTEKKTAKKQLLFKEAKRLYDAANVGRMRHST